MVYTLIMWYCMQPAGMCGLPVVVHERMYLEDCTVAAQTIELETPYEAICVPMKRRH